MNRIYGNKFRDLNTGHFYSYRCQSKVCKISYYECLVKDCVSKLSVRDGIKRQYNGPHNHTIDEVNDLMTMVEMKKSMVIKAQSEKYDHFPPLDLYKYVMNLYNGARLELPENHKDKSVKLIKNQRVRRRHRARYEQKIRKGSTTSTESSLVDSSHENMGSFSSNITAASLLTSDSDRQTSPKQNAGQNQNQLGSVEDFAMPSSGASFSPSNEFECINIISDDEDNPLFNIDALNNINIGELLKTSSLFSDEKVPSVFFSDFQNNLSSQNSVDKCVERETTKKSTDQEKDSKQPGLAVSIDIEKLFHNAANKLLQSNPSKEAAKLLDHIRKRNHVLQQKRSSLGTLDLSGPKISKVESWSDREKSQSLTQLNDHTQFQPPVPKLMIRKRNPTDASCNCILDAVSTAERHMCRAKRLSESSDSSWGISRLSLAPPRKPMKFAYDGTFLTDAEQELYPSIDEVKLEPDGDKDNDMEIDASVVDVILPVRPNVADASTQTNLTLLCKCERDRVQKIRKRLEEQSMQQLLAEIRQTIGELNELKTGANTINLKTELDFDMKDKCI